MYRGRNTQSPVNIGLTGFNYVEKTSHFVNRFPENLNTCKITVAETRYIKSL